MYSFILAFSTDLYAFSFNPTVSNALNGPAAFAFARNCA